MNNKLLLSFFILIFISCGSNEDNEDILRSANFYLSERNCTKANEVLSEVPDLQADHFSLITKSSALVCDTSFSEVSFITDEIEVLDTNEIFTSFTKFSTSADNEVESDEYLKIKSAINFIVNSTESSFLTNDRESKYGTQHITGINLHLSMLILTNIGKWLRVYGNTDVSGVKGSGTFGNNCIYDYSTLDAQTAIVAFPTGACPNPPGIVGHPDLDSSLSLSVRSGRICDFIVNTNHLLDIMLNTDLASSDLADVASVAPEIESIIDDATTREPDLLPIFSLYNYEECTEFGETASNFDLFELYLAVFLETNLL